MDGRDEEKVVESDNNWVSECHLSNHIRTGIQHTKQDDRFILLKRVLYEQCISSQKDTDIVIRLCVYKCKRNTSSNIHYALASI